MAHRSTSINGGLCHCWETRTRRITRLSVPGCHAPGKRTRCPTCFPGGTSAGARPSPLAVFPCGRSDSMSFHAGWVEFTTIEECIPVDVRVASPYCRVGWEHSVCPTRRRTPGCSDAPPLEGGTVLETASQPDATPAPLVGTDRVGIRLGHARS